MKCNICEENIYTEDFYYLNDNGYIECDNCHKEQGCKLLIEESKGNYVDNTNKEYCDMLGLVA